MSTRTQPMFARLTVRKTVHFVSTLEVYEVCTVTPLKPVIETTGVEIIEELPPSVPGLRKAQPAHLKLVRKSA